MQLRRRHFPNTVITKNPANQKFYIHFFIDNYNANISLYTLRFRRVKKGLISRKIIGMLGYTVP